MSWDDLDQVKKDGGEALKQAKQKSAEICQMYSRVFSSQDGQKVLAHMVQGYVMGNNTNLSEPNIDYVAAYKNGQGSVIKDIIMLINKASEI